MDRRVIRRIVLIAVLITLTLCIGTVGFRLVEGYTLFDAFYMTLITVTTVGYQEIRHLSYTGRIFNSFLILFGVTAMFFAVGIMTQTIIELQLEDRFGQRRKRRAIMQMADHYIVCGFGRVGRNAALELQRADLPFVVVDRSPQRVEAAASAGMLAMHADATRDDTLREAGIDRARGFIAALPTDAENLFVILSAKTLNPKLIVVTRASEEDAEEKLRRAGADTVFSPYSMAGQRLAQALIRPHVVQLLEFPGKAAGLAVTIEQLQIPPESKLVSRKIGDLAVSGAKVLVLAIKRADGRTIFNPSADLQIAPGDFLIVMGEEARRRDIESVLLGYATSGSSC